MCSSLVCLFDCVFVSLCLGEMTDASKIWQKLLSPSFQHSQSKASKFCHITTDGIANNSRQYRVVWGENMVFDENMVFGENIIFG